ncbi:SRPBCC domain-containing protein [Paenibacillus arenilitoris]|uniref:SRPBCC domain-containing protein n=1 Tax=Paenibacillus arenilitoris TaxID=2772299 RepID=A0A927CQK2_9BACL|nr:SRPBCC domain-containing protein [Paenibacillus arenilitoris]MBD2872339.1 SRPBCC domain-containing protein [Paenibacillus arenilitoris]
MTDNVDATKAANNEFVITRELDAPRELVFKAWTEPEHLQRWWGPKGLTITVVKLDLRPGGLFHYIMRTPEGDETWGRFAYREITAPERLVYVNSFSDPEGGIVRPPFDDPWPLEILNTVTLEEQDGKTTVTISAIPVNASEEETRVFRAGFESMEQGYGGTFDQLAEHLAAL